MTMSLSVDSPTALLIALALWCAIAITAWLRRARLARPAALCLAAGLALLATAAGQPHIDLPQPGHPVVMVDLSPSTRIATYRDRAALDRRLRTLLGTQPHRIVYFSDDARNTVNGNPLPDLPADRTRFVPPPDATAIMLFSDGQFEPPETSPPVFAVIDPQLADTGDAAITDLRWNDGAAVMTVHNQSDTPRRLTINNESADAPPGRRVIVFDNLDATASLATTLDPGDPWGENDALSILPPPPAQPQRWWVSTAQPPPAGWTAIAPHQLPTTAAEWLDPGVIVLDNTPADALSLGQMQRLHQYARDLGGSVLIVGGDRAFAAGAYGNTPIDTLSPLASQPPQPARHWLILTDASGSMAQPIDGATRLQIASAAMTAALNALPRQDLITLGSFSQTVRWWTETTAVDAALAQPIPPADLHPHGPTNLQAALHQVITAIDPALSTEMLLLTDGQATLDNADAFIDAMNRRNIRLHLLATGNGEAIAPLEQIVQATGGLVVREFDPRQWTGRAAALARRAMPDGIMRQPVAIESVGGPLPFDPGRVAEWNRTWLKDDATLLAQARLEDADVPMIGRWQFGSGTVIAAGYALPPASAAALADTIAAPPRDPRFAVQWTAGPRLGVRVDAIANGQYLNELPLMLDLAPADAPADVTSMPIPQIAPGQYAATVPAPRQPAIATVRLDRTLLDRRAVAGRYPAEFAGIGNDREALASLAQRTGGRLIEPDDNRPLDLPAHRRRSDITPAVVAAAIALLATGLILWRRG